MLLTSLAALGLIILTGAGTTKNGEGRVFPMTDHLRTLLETQYAAHLRLKKAGTICPHVFFREVAKGRGEGSGRTMDSALLVVGLFVANSDRVQDNSLISKARRNGGEASSCGTCSWH